MRRGRFLIPYSVFWLVILSGCAAKLKVEPPVSTPRQEVQTAIPPLPFPRTLEQGPPALPAQPAIPEPAWSFYQEGRRLERENQLSAAVAAYLQAAAAAPNEPRILTGLGTAYLQSGDLHSARLHLSRSIQLDGRDPQSRLGLGYVYLQQKNYAKAIKELESSVALRPSPRGDYLLGEAYEKSGDKVKALHYYRAVVAADSHSKLGRSAAEQIRQLEEK